MELLEVYRTMMHEPEVIFGNEEVVAPDGTFLVVEESPIGISIRASAGRLQFVYHMCDEILSFYKEGSITAVDIYNQYLKEYVDTQYELSKDEMMHIDIAYNFKGIDNG